MLAWADCVTWAEAAGVLNTSAVAKVIRHGVFKMSSREVMDLLGQRIPMVAL